MLYDLGSQLRLGGGKKKDDDDNLDEGIYNTFVYITYTYCSLSDAQKATLWSKDLRCPIYYSTLDGVEQMQKSKDPRYSRTRTQTPRSCLCRHLQHRLLMSHVVMRQCSSSYWRRVCRRGHGNSRLLYFSNAVATFTICRDRCVQSRSDTNMIVVVRTSPSSVTGRDETTTGLETDEVYEAPKVVSQSSSTHVQSRPKFAKLRHVERCIYQVPGVVLGKEC